MSVVIYKNTKSKEPIKWNRVYSNKSLLLLEALLNDEKPSAINNYGISRPSNYIIELRKLLKDKILTVEVKNLSYDVYRLIDSYDARREVINLIEKIKIELNQK